MLSYWGDNGYLSLYTDNIHTGPLYASENGHPIHSSKTDGGEGGCWSLLRETQGLERPMFVYVCVVLSQGVVVTTTTRLP